MTIKPLTRDGFAKQFTGHAVIDTNNVSADLTKKLGELGVSVADLKKVAGPDGQIKGDEFKALFKVVDAFDAKAGDSKLQLTGATNELNVAGQLNQALLEEVKNNRGFSQYAKPGSAPAAAEQPALGIESNALKVDVKDRKAAVALPVVGIDQVAYGAQLKIDGQKACFQAAVAQVERYNDAAFGRNAPRLNDASQTIQMAYAEDELGALEVDPTQVKLGREYIDKALDVGAPVLVGVSYDDENFNLDKLTEHFVTIHKRGYDAEGRLFYEFKDPGAGGRTGRAYVDADSGKLFKVGDGKSEYVRSANYEFTQVRTYKGIE